MQEYIEESDFIKILKTGKDYYVKDYIIYASKELIKKYFFEIIQILKYDYDFISEFVNNLSGAEQDECVKKIIEFVNNNENNINETMLIRIWQVLRQDVKLNNTNYVDIMVEKGKEEQNTYLQFFWKDEIDEIITEKFISVLRIVQDSEDLVKFYAFYPIKEELKLDLLKKLEINPDIIPIAWQLFDEEAQEGAFENLIKKVSDNPKLVKSIWQGYKSQQDKFYEIIDRFKQYNPQMLSSIISVTQYDILKDNLMEIIDENKENTIVIANIWKGLENLVEENTLSRTDYNNLFKKIFELVKDDYDALQIVWNSTESNCQLENEDAFREIFEIIRNAEKDLADLWINTNQIIQKNNANLFDEVIVKAKKNGRKLSEIWIRTDDNVQENYQEIFLEVIRENKENIESILAIWNSTSHQLRLNRFKETYKILSGNAEDIEQIFEIYKKIYLENNDIINILPTELVEIFSLENQNYFGKDKLSQMACYPDIVRKMNSLTKKQREVLASCLNRYMEKYNISEWVYLCSSILEHIDDFNELISAGEFTNQDIDKLNILMTDENIFNITTLKELRNIDKMRKYKCDKMMQSPFFEDRVEAICISKFGYSSKKLKVILEKFGKDIDKIDNEELKSFIYSLDLLLKYAHYKYKALDQIYETVKPVSEINIMAIERKLKDEYLKLYNQQLFRCKDAVKNEKFGEGIYELPLDETGHIKNFSMIITSVAPYCQRDIEDFYEDWNRNTIASQHFCTAFIRRDMIKHPPILNFCYGFENMADNSLVFSAPFDINSSKEAFNSSAQGNVVYLGPDEQIKQTNGRHNEMDFYRIQNGVRKQPDYIVCFKERENLNDRMINEYSKSIFENSIRLAKIARQQFKEKNGRDIPIIVVDCQKCLEAEKMELKELIKEYEINPSLELAKKIWVKFSNNGKNNIRLFDEVFTDEKSKEIFKDIFSKIHYNAEYKKQMLYDEQQIATSGEFTKVFSQISDAIEKDVR